MPLPEDGSLKVLCVILLAGVTCVLSTDVDEPVFNVDTSNVIIYEATNKHEYFGYTVALYAKDGDYWLFAGAPRGNDTTVNFKETDKSPGKVYKCANGDACTPVQVQNNNFNAKLGARNTTENNTDALFGSTLDINKDTFLACAPKSFVFFAADETAYRLFGACFRGPIREVINDTYKSMTKLKDLRGAANLLKNISGYKEDPFFVYGQSGFSGFVGEQGETILGAPGIYSQTGGVMEYRTGIRPRIATSENRRQKPKLNLLGYAMSSVKLDRNSNTLVASSPSMTDPKIIWFKSIPISNHSMEAFTIIKNENSAKFEGFGHSLAGGDIDADGTEELLVGVPFHSLQPNFAKGDVGLVYVFNTKANKWNLKPWKTIDGADLGLESGARFGTAMASLNDINGDSFCDFAISAPYADNGRGLVMIFMGAKSGLVLRKTIRASDYDDSNLGRKIRGFGYSFSRPVDIDGNGQRDFAIGAYNSGHVVIMRSRPIGTLRVNLKLSEDGPISLKSTEIGLSAEIRYLLKANESSNLNVSIALTVQSKYWHFPNKGSDSHKHKEIIILRSNEAEVIKLNLTQNAGFKAHEKSNQELIIKAEAIPLITETNSTFLVDTSSGKIGSDNDLFEKFTPMFASTKFNVELRQTFQRGCEELNNCIFDYNVLISLADREVIWKDDIEIPVTVMISHSGDFVDADLELSIPAGFRVDKSSCHLVESKICHLNYGPSRNITFSLVLENEEGVEGDLITIGAKVFPLHVDKNKVIKDKKSINRVNVASVSITGVPAKNSYNYLKDPIDMQFDFQALRHGPTNVKSVELSLRFPVALNGKHFAEIEVPKIADEIGSCNTTDTLVQYESKEETNDIHVNGSLSQTPPLDIACGKGAFQCVEFICHLGDSFKHSSALSISARVNYKNPGSVNKKTVSIRYTVDAAINITNPKNVRRAPHASTEATLVSVQINRKIKEDITDVSWWIIAAAVGSATLTLLTISVLLYKCGFFKRQQKEALKQIKRTTTMLADQNIMFIRPGPSVCEAGPSDDAEEPSVPLASEDDIEQKDL